MKLSETTLTILKNFSTINQNLIVEPGNVITTMSPLKSVIAKAQITETFDKPFAIWELSKFLGVTSLFNEPDFEFGDKQVQISSGRQKTKYTYADSALVEKPKSIKWPAADDVLFEINAVDLTKTLKALGVLGLQEIAFVGDGKNITIQALSSKNPTADSFSIIIDETDKTFTAILKAENIKLLQQDYKVVVSPKGIMHFTGTNIEYWLVLEQNSSF